MPIESWWADLCVEGDGVGWMSTSDPMRRFGTRLLLASPQAVDRLSLAVEIIELVTHPGSTPAVSQSSS